MKIPAPMMVPMMMEIPRSRVTFFPSSTFLSSLSFSFPLASDWAPFWETLCPFAETPWSFWDDADLFAIFLDIVKYKHTHTHTHTQGQSLWFGVDSKCVLPGMCPPGQAWIHSDCVTDPVKLTKLGEQLNSREEKPLHPLSPFLSLFLSFMPCSLTSHFPAPEDGSLPLLLHQTFFLCSSISVTV